MERRSEPGRRAEEVKKRRMKRKGEGEERDKEEGRKRRYKVLCHLEVFDCFRIIQI